MKRLQRWIGRCGTLLVIAVSIHATCLIARGQAEVEGLDALSIESLDPEAAPASAPVPPSPESLSPPSEGATDALAIEPLAVEAPEPVVPESPSAMMPDAIEAEPAVTLAAEPEVEAVVEPSPEDLPSETPVAGESPVAEGDAFAGDELPGAAPSEDVTSLEEAPVGADDLEPAAVGAGGGAAPAAQVVSPAVTVLKEGEELRRRAYRQHADEKMAAAQKAFEAKDYLASQELYEQARLAFTQLGDLPGVKEKQKAIRAAITECKFRRAVVMTRQGDYDNAEKLARDASFEGHERAPKLIDEIAKLRNKPLPPPPPTPIRWKQEDFIQKSKEVRQKLREGRAHYMAGEYDKAQGSFESVLKQDPDNLEAVRWREKVANERYDNASYELESTRADMIADVRDAWNPQNYAVDEEPPKPGREQEESRRRVVDTKREQILKKMEEIKIPEIDFRQANINDVIEFLQEQSIANDLSDDPTVPKGVNIILNLGVGVGAAAPQGGQAGGEVDFFAEGGDQPAEAAPAGGNIPFITFRARDISLMEALRIVSTVTGLKSRVEGNVVMIVPKDSPDDLIIHRMYSVLPSVKDVISSLRESMGGGGGGEGEGDFATLEATEIQSEEGDWKSFFTELGVSWPKGSSIKYVAPISRLMVANTADNLAVFEQRLAALNVVPRQIEIEARFVEVAQSDLNSLGFEYLLTDDWEIAEKEGGFVGTRERIIMPETDFTKGNRYLDDTRNLLTYGAQDSLLSVASVLTNPELSVVLHALEQRGNTDLLSAPKVTTQAGQEATIKMVTEYIYPSDYQIEPGIPATLNADGTVQTPGQPPVVTPATFETREVGVILSVLPEVTSDGQMISLTLTPEVVTEPIWKDYGLTYYDGYGNTIKIPIEQPFFNTRTINTSVMIYNGATVVMGGMITEIRNTANDKIPLLGDIPILGRLFQSNYDSSEKRNLLIFVTARLVDPAGRLVREESEALQTLLPKIGAKPAEGGGGIDAAAATP